MARKIVVRIGPLIAVIALLAIVFEEIHLPFLGRDFISFWTGSQAIRAGHSPYDQDFQLAVQLANGWDSHVEFFPFHPYVYPPWLALLIWPLTWLPYRVAFEVWLALNLVLAAVAIRLLMDMLQPRGRSYALALAWLMIFLYLPTLHGIVVGQTHLLLFFLMAVVVWATTAQHDRTAGIALGMMSIKPQVGLVLAGLWGVYWLIQHRWQALLSLVVTGLACVAVSFVVVPNWVTDMLAASDRFTALTGLPLLPSGFRDYPTLYAAVRVGLEQSPALLVVTGMGLLSTLVLLAARMRSLTLQPARVSALICAGLFVITPYARVYELTLLIWPQLYFAFGSRVGWPRALKTSVVMTIYLAPLLLLLAGAWGVWNIVVPLLMLWALLLAEVRIGPDFR